LREELAFFVESNLAHFLTSCPLCPFLAWGVFFFSVSRPPPKANAFRPIPGPTIFKEIPIAAKVG